MSADNFVYIKKFGPNDFRWGMGFADEVDNGYLPDDRLTNGPFKTPLEAKRNAEKEYPVIEYGFKFSDDCLNHGG